jgi:phage gp29-like protein
MKFTRQPAFSWRDYYNPLASLTVSRLVAMEDASVRGQHADIQWFYEHMERADVMVQAAVARRLSFVDSLDWEIRSVDGADTFLAEEQRALLRHAYEKITNFRDATRHLASALFRGLAVLEKEFTGYASFVSALHPLHPWQFVDIMPGPSLRFNQHADSDCNPGEFVDPKDVVVFRSPPIFRSISRHYFGKTLAIADWDTALETSANQSIFVIAPPGASESDLQEFYDLARNVVSNHRGVLPHDTKVETFDPAGSRNSVPYFDRIKYCDEQIILAATGGLLTMLTQSGSGTLAGNAHSDTLLGLAKSDAARLSEVFQNSLDKPFLDSFFPRQPHVAYFSFDIPQKEDTAALISSVANLSWAGFRVQREQLEEKTGLKLEDIPRPDDRPSESVQPVEIQV